MAWFRNVKFVRKIQLGFTFLAAISTVIALIGYIQISKMMSIKEKIFDEFVKPQYLVNDVYSRFQQSQFLMMQFSSPAFGDKVSENLKIYSELKKNIDIGIDSLLKRNWDPEIQKSIKDVKEKWINYKSLVADAIISASITQNYEMASDISTTSAEEIGAELKSRFEKIHKVLVYKSNLLDEDIKETVQNSLILTISGAIIGTMVFLLCIFYLAPALSKPINYLKEIVTEFSLGNYESEIVTNSRDEIGELTLLFTNLQQEQKKKIFAAEQIAKGIIYKVQPASDKDALANAFNKETETINAILEEANLLIKANEQGKLNVRGDHSRFSGEWANLIIGINSILEAVVLPINEAADVLIKMSTGDLTISVTGDYKGDHQLIKDSINKLAVSMNKTLSRVNDTISAVASASNDINESTEQMSAGAEEQRKQTIEVASAIDEMTKTIIDTTRNAGAASDASKKAGDIARVGDKAVRDTITGMNRIAEAVDRTSTTIHKLGESNNKITSIIEVIDDIADQTNLLALNAAIEAARAGEQGRGFAVVADEVRKLAERTTNATKEVAKMIKQIQLETKGAVNLMQEGIKEVEKGKELADHSGESLRKIITGTEQVVDIVMQVAAASEQQSASSEEISRSIENINNVTQGNTSGVKQIAKAADELSILTADLESLISQFKLNKKVEDILV